MRRRVLKAKVKSLIARLRPRAGRVRRGLLRRHQSLVLLLRSRLARRLDPDSLAQHYDTLKAHHFGKPSQLDVGNRLIPDVYLGDAIASGAPGGERTKDDDV